MNFLLDTNAVLWWFAGSNRFKKTMRDTLTDRMSAVFVSTVSTWEISIKVAIGKLKLPQDPRSYLVPRIVRAGFTVLPVLAEHTYEITSLPQHHFDPFDRLLIAQARIENLSIVTGDRAFAQYDVHCTMI